MKNTIKFLAIAILINISFWAVDAQEENVIAVNEGSTKKVEKKVESTKKQSSPDNNSWTGFYIGGYIGETIGQANPVYLDNGNGFFFNATQRGIVEAAGNQKIKSNSFNGGGTFGYNYQKGKILVGGEVDFGLNKFRQSTPATGSRLPTNNGLEVFTFTVDQTVKSDWLMTARPRVGVATAKAVFYVTGGVAVTNIKYDGKLTTRLTTSSIPLNIIEGKGTGSFNKTKAGWTAGAGIEFKVAKHWSIKGEYLFTQFNRVATTSNNFGVVNIVSGSSANFPQNNFNHSTDLKSHSIRFGINYRF